MANQLDLEEQEQLDQLKHFWQQWGNAITWLAIVVLGSFAAWNGYQYWQRSQAAQAAAMYDEVERVLKSGDPARLDRALADMKDKFAGTVYAQQAALLAAKSYFEAGKTDAAKVALVWVIEKSGDEGYRAVARLRLAAVLLEAKEYDEGLKQLTAPMPGEFAALAADRRGDFLVLQGKKDLARAEYEQAFKGLDDRGEYRRLVEVKLNALGVNPRAADAVEVKK